MTQIKRRGSLSIALAACLGLAAACGSPPPPTENYQALGNPKREEFIIGTSDLLRIVVWHNTELTTDVRVRPDGNITLPLVGDVPAAGKTTKQLGADLTTKLGAFVKDASVSVTVVEVNSYAVSVIGNVGHPGLFQLKHYVTVSEALALAGGMTKYAGDDVIVIRTWKQTTPRRIHVPYSKIMDGTMPEADITLYAGDTVLVQ